MNIRAFKLLPVVLLILLSPVVSRASIAYQFQSTGYVYGADSVSITPPYNVSGQIEIAVFNLINIDPDFYFLTPTPISAPSGWNEIISNTFYGIGVYRAAWYRIANGSTSSISWGFGLPLRGQVSILVYGGVDTSNPVDTASFKNDWQLSTTHVTNAVTTDFANCLVLSAWFSADTGISFLDAEEAARINFAGISQQAQRPMIVFDEIQSASGSSGVKTATTSANSYCQSIMVALKPN